MTSIIFASISSFFRSHKPKLYQCNLVLLAVLSLSCIALEASADLIDRQKIEPLLANTELAETPKIELSTQSPVPYYSQAQIRELGFNITRQLRCPTSANQTLFDSQSRIASELKGQIFLMLEQGQTKDEIIDFLVARYGEKMRYMPSLKVNTLLLWLFPLLLVLLTIASVVWFIRPQFAPKTSPQLLPQASQESIDG